MKRLAWMAPIVLLVLGVLAASDKPPARKTSAIDVMMRSKLGSSQKVLEGLVAKDFGLVQKGAKELLNVCNAEDWRSSDEQVYAHFKTELRRQAEKLDTFGDAQNLEGTTFAYLSLISTCVDCHAHCRDVLRIAAEPPNLKPVPAPSDVSNADEQRPLRR